MRSLLGQCLRSSLRRICGARNGPCLRLHCAIGGTVGSLRGTVTTPTRRRRSPASPSRSLHRPAATLRRRTRMASTPSRASGPIRICSPSHTRATRTTRRATLPSTKTHGWSSTSACTKRCDRSGGSPHNRRRRSSNATRRRTFMRSVQGADPADRPPVEPERGDVAGLAARRQRRRRRDERSLRFLPLIRGGLQNDQGYQVDGIDATEPLTNEFINNLVFNGSSSVNVTAGPGDASKGGSGSGYVNVVTKTGTYPASGYAAIRRRRLRLRAQRLVRIRAGSPRGDYSFFLSGRYDRDFGGCCTPPFGNTWGHWSSSNPDTLGQVGFEVTNDTVANLLFRFGRDKANTIQSGTSGARTTSSGVTGSIRRRIPTRPLTPPTFRSIKRRRSSSVGRSR